MKIRRFVKISRPVIILEELSRSSVANHTAHWVQSAHERKSAQLKKVQWVFLDQTEENKNRMEMKWYPHSELNRNQRFRKPLLYPFELWRQPGAF
jgi:hypothetical protein